MSGENPESNLRSDRVVSIGLVSTPIAISSTFAKTSQIVKENAETCRMSLVWFGCGSGSCTGLFERFWCSVRTVSLGKCFHHVSPQFWQKGCGSSCGFSPENWFWCSRFSVPANKRFRWFRFLIPTRSCATLAKGGGGFGEVGRVGRNKLQVDWGKDYRIHQRCPRVWKTKCLNRPNKWFGVCLRPGQDQ